MEFIAGYDAAQEADFSRSAMLKHVRLISFHLVQYRLSTRGFDELRFAMTALSSAKRHWRLGVIIVACVALLFSAAYFALVAAFPPARLAAMLGEEIKRTTGRDFRVNGELSIRFLPTLAVVANDVALSNAEWGTRPEMVTLQQVAFEIALRPLLDQEIRILSVDVKGADALLESNGKGGFNWMFASNEATAGAYGASLPVIDLERLTLSGTRITYRDGDKGTVRGVNIEKLEMQLQDDHVQLSGALEFERQRWQINGQIGRLVALLGSEADWPFDLRFVTEGAKLSATGKVGTEKEARAVHAELSAQISAATALNALFAGDVMLPLPLDIRATLVRTADLIRADPLRVAHAGQEVDGRITVDSSGEKLRIEGLLSSPVFDVDKWFIGKSSPATAAKGQAQLFGDAPLPFAVLPTIPLQLEFRVDRLLLAGVPPLSAVSGRLKAEPGLFVIDPLSLAAEGGQVKGRMEVTQHPGVAPRTVLAIDAKGLSVGALSGRDERFRGGRADLKANLTLTGVTPRRLAASATGDVLLSIRKTTFAGKDAALELNPLESLLQVLIPGQHLQQGLDIECAVARLPLLHGVARIDRSIAMETKQIAVSASGEVDLTRQTLSLVFQPQAKKGLGLTQSSLAQLVMLKGPLLAPEVGIDPKGVAQEAATLGVAVATGGISWLAGRVLNERASTDACRIASAGSGARPSSSKAVKRKWPG